MINRTVQGALLAAALLVASAMPAAAQTVGVGLSFLGDNGGTGIQADAAVPFSKTSSGKSIDLVGDISYYRNGDDLPIVDFNISTLMVQVGGRVSGKANDKVSWFGQGLLGYRHFGVGGDSTACDLPGVDCGSNGAVLTVGGALTYDFNEKSGVKGQLDFPIPIGGDGDTTTRFTIAYVMKLGK